MKSESWEGETFHSEYEPESRPLRSASTGELLGHLFHTVGELLKKEIELARAEVKSTAKGAAAKAVGVAVAFVFMLIGVALLFTALVLVLAHVMAPWLSALVVGVFALIVGAVMVKSAKSKAVEKPFERTQRTLKENVRWMKERLA